MATCKHTKELERWFDGESPDSTWIERHADECPPCKSYLAFLKKTRHAVHTMTARQEIGEGQFAAFMNDVRDGTARAPRRGPRLWAMVSLMAAAFIVVASLITLYPGGPTPARAETIVEDHFTELDGATTTPIYEGDEITGVWVNTPPLSEKEI